MKTMKTILAIFLLAVTANIGLAQKNIYIHEGANKYKSTTQKADSITFGDFRTPGTVILSNYDTLTPRKYSQDSHGKVTWKATYKGNANNVPIEGGFGVNPVKILFDEANPANIKFDAAVDLSTVVTFELGREGIDHCATSNIGVVSANTGIDDITYRENAAQPTGFDTIVTPVWAITDSLSSWATLVAVPGSVTFKGDGYEAQAQFTFRGLTTTIPVYFEYLGSSVRTGTNLYHSFEGSFEFVAGSLATDPYYCGGNIKSKVKVHINLLMRDDT